MASFLSFNDLIKNFWEWLLVLEMFALAAWEINRIRECVWNLACIGDRIFSYVAFFFIFHIKTLGKKYRSICQDVEPVVRQLFV